MGIRETMVKTLNKHIYTQPFIYWAPTGIDNYGRRTYANPVLAFGELKDDFQVIREGAGEELISNAMLMTFAPLKSEYWIAITADTQQSQVTESNDPKTVSGAREVVMVSTSPIPKTYIDNSSGRSRALEIVSARLAERGTN